MEREGGPDPGPEAEAEPELARMCGVVMAVN